MNENPNSRLVSKGAFGETAPRALLSLAGFFAIMCLWQARSTLWIIVPTIIGFLVGVSSRNWRISPFAFIAVVAGMALLVADAASDTGVALASGGIAAVFADDVRRAIRIGRGEEVPRAKRPRAWVFNLVMATFYLLVMISLMITR